MKKNSRPQLPQLFLTENGCKYVRKLILRLEEALEKLTDEEERKATNYRLTIARAKLKLPRVDVVEQCKICLPGNGVKIKINNKTPLYLVLDGISICEHHLPPEYAVVAANSSLGAALLGLKIGGKGSFEQNGKQTFVVEKIDTPSMAKWLFKYDVSSDVAAIS